MHYHGKSWPSKEACDDEERWLRIEYIEFWDFPRLFVLEHRNRTLVFEAPFLPLDDEYSDFFVIKELKGKENWAENHKKAEVATILPVDQFTFDETLRKFILKDCIDRFISE